MTIDEIMKLDREIGDYCLRPPSHRGKSEMIRRLREMTTSTVEPKDVEIQGHEPTAIFIDEAAELDEVTIETLKERMTMKRPPFSYYHRMDKWERKADAAVRRGDHKREEFCRSKRTHYRRLGWRQEGVGLPVSSI